MLTSIAASAAIATAITLPRKLDPFMLQTDRCLLETMSDRDDWRARQEIVEMCGVLEDEENVPTYLQNPKYMVEKVWYDYTTRYLRPLGELEDVLSRLSELADYVPQDRQADIDAANQAKTATQVQQSLATCSSLLEDARAAYEKEQERIRQEKEKAKQQAQTTTTYSMSNGSGLTAASGVNYYNGRKETYYSSRVLYHYRTSEWWVDSEGFYRTSGGYYVVAASDMPQGTVFSTSKGAAMVLDSGCAAGVTDFYVNW